MSIKFNREKVVKPVVNQYEDKCLGVCSEGCRCHSLFLVEKDEDDITLTLLEGTKKPSHTKPLDSFWGMEDVEERDGKLCWKKEANEGLVSLIREFDAEDLGVTGDIDTVHGAYKDCGVWFIEEECGSFDCSLDNLEDRIKELNLEDGVYKILVEVGCWMEFHHEYGNEGNGDIAAEVIERVGDLER